MTALIAALSPFLIKLLLPLMLSALLGVVALAQVKLRAETDARIKNDKVRAVADKFEDGLFAVVRWLSQTVVEDAKDNGKFDADLAAKVKQQAVDAVKAKFTPEELPHLLSYLGVTSAEQADAAVAVHVEATVHAIKSSAGAAAAANAVLGK